MLPEDCQVFAQVLESATEGKGPDRAVSVPTLLSAYNERRLEDALAAVALSEKGMGGARTSTLRFAATMLVTMTLHKTLGLLAPGVRSCRLGIFCWRYDVLPGRNRSGGRGRRYVVCVCYSGSARNDIACATDIFYSAPK